jgi:hypothetical protein
MKSNFGRTIFPITAAALLVVAAAVPVAVPSGDPKLDRAIEKANSEFAAAMKTGDATVIASPYTDRAGSI